LPKCTTGGKYGYINKAGKEVIPIQFDEIDFVDSKGGNLARVKNNNKHGFFSIDGSVDIPCIYEEISLFIREGLVAAKLNGKWGYVNEQNETVIPFMYEEVTDFKKGLAQVKNQGLWYYINKKNQWVMPPHPSFWLED
jgi:hypothetical protein